MEMSRMNLPQNSPDTAVANATGRVQRSRVSAVLGLIQDHAPDAGKKSRQRRLLLSTALPAAMFAAASTPFVVSPAWADAECGTPGAGGVVVCDNSGTPASNANPYPDGIRYDINLPLVAGLDPLSGVNPLVGVDLTATGIAVIGDALPEFLGAGISVQSHVGLPLITGPIAIDVIDSSIRTSPVGTTSEFQVNGIVASSGGAITITVTNSDVTTTGDGSAGIFASSNTLGLVSVDTETSTVATLGSGSGGIVAESVGGGTLSVTTGRIDTQGDNSSGVFANGSGATDVTSTADLISTAGDGSAGIFAQTGAGPLTVTSGAIETGCRFSRYRHGQFRLGSDRHRLDGGPDHNPGR